MLDLKPIKRRFKKCLAWGVRSNGTKGLFCIVVEERIIADAVNKPDVELILSATKRVIPALISEIERLRNRVEYLEAHHIPEPAYTEQPKYYTIPNRLEGKSE